MADANNISIIPFDARYATETVAMWRASKENAIGQPEMHSFDEHLYFLNQILCVDNTVYLAIENKCDSVVGILATDGTMINQLYVHLGYQGSGIGSRLLDLAKSSSGGRLQLHTFECNRPAQQFYEKHGFRAIGRDDDNEEGLSALVYEWGPP